MKEKINVQELIVRISEKAGTSKKLSADLLRIFTELVGTGLERDGEIRIAGLGTFKLKWVNTRTARNLRTGEAVTVPAHNKVVFFPEKALKEKVNEDYKFLTYTVLEEEEKKVVSPQPSVASPQSSVDSRQLSVVSQEEEKEKKREEERKKGDVPPVPEKEVYRRRKLIWWIIPLVFVIIALLIVIFYMKNCQDQLAFTKTESGSREQVIAPSETAPPGEEAIVQTTPAEMPQDTTAETSAPQSTEPSQGTMTGFKEQAYTTAEGKHLFQVARETYGNPFLWALIYKENSEKIPDPEQVPKGIELVIPSLEGIPSLLSGTDSTRIAEGYRMLYEYYNSKGHERSRDFYFAMKAYTPK